MKIEIRMKCISYSLWEDDLLSISQRLNLAIILDSLYGIQFMGIMSRISDVTDLKYNIIDCIISRDKWFQFIEKTWRLI